MDALDPGVCAHRRAADGHRRHGLGAVAALDETGVDQGSRERGEGQTPGARVREEERADPNAVACQQQLLATAVPNREREFAVQRLREGTCGEGMKDHVMRRRVIGAARQPEIRCHRKGTAALKGRLLRIGEAGAHGHTRERDASGTPDTFRGRPAKPEAGRHPMYRFKRIQGVATPQLPANQLDHASVTPP